MPVAVAPGRQIARSEALPRDGARWRPIRSSGCDRPGDHDPTSGAARPSSGERRRYLPRVLSGVQALVVDDDPDSAELFSTALTVCGAVVTTASRAAEALRLLTTRRFDVVVSDIAMPGGDGYWLIREVRRLADTHAHRLPLVAVTAFGREHSRPRTLAAGFADHLEKPVDPELLCLTVAKVVGR